MKIIFNHIIHINYRIEGFIDVDKEICVIDVIDLTTEKKTDDVSVLDDVDNKLDTELFTKLIAYCKYVNPYHIIDLNFDEIMYEFDMKKDLYRKKIFQLLTSQKKENKNEYRIDTTDIEYFCFM